MTQYNAPVPTPQPIPQPIPVQTVPFQAAPGQPITVQYVQPVPVQAPVQLYAPAVQEPTQLVDQRKARTAKRLKLVMLVLWILIMIPVTVVRHTHGFAESMIIAVIAGGIVGWIEHLIEKRLGLK